VQLEQPVLAVQLRGRRLHGGGIDGRDDHDVHVQRPQRVQAPGLQGAVDQGEAAAERKLIADRIKQMRLDVLGVQEVEDINTLRRFVADDLGGLYQYSVLIEGNDPRLIDVGLLSKHPFAGVTSWQFAADPADPKQTVFSRDLLQLEVMN